MFTPKLAILGVDVELKLRALDIFGIRDATQVVDEACSSQRRRSDL